MNPQTTFLIDVKTHGDFLNYVFICGLSIAYPIRNDYISCQDGTKIGLVNFFDQDDNIDLNDYLALDISEKLYYFSHHPWIEYSFTIMNETQIIGRIYLKSSSIIEKDKKSALIKKYRVIKKWIKERRLIVHSV